MKKTTMHKPNFRNTAGLCLLSAMMLLCSCDKNVPTTYISDQRLRDALLLKKGTYFVYQDSIDNRVDSFYTILGGSIYFANQFNSQDEIIAKWESIDCDFTDYPELHGHRFRLGCGSTTISDKISFNYDFPNGYTGICWKVPFVVGETANFLGHYQVKYSTHHTVLDVAGTRYNDVYEVHTLGEDGKEVRSFFSPTSGVVRFVLCDSNRVKHVWNLKRFRLVR